MPKSIELVVGSKYGRITVKAEIPQSGRTVVGICDCGKEVHVKFKMLRNGNTSSCGCLRREMVSAKNHKHGMCKKIPEYTHWKSMRQRCNDPNSFKYPSYGAVGISVHPSWDDFEQFLRDVGRMPSPKHTLDRYPNRNGNYEPGNVRWATASEQVRNRDCMPAIEYNGETVLVIELAERHGLKACQLQNRLRRGWSVKDALTIPIKRGNNQCVKNKR